MKDPKVALIILNWNGKEDTIKCLESLEKLTYSNYEIFLVDNGSSDGSQEAFEKGFPHITLIKNHENFGFAKGNNIGIKAALEKGSDYLLLLNNDTIVRENLIEVFLEKMQSYPDGAILGGKILSMKDPSILDHLGGQWNKTKAIFDLVGLKDNEESFSKDQMLDYACGCVLFFPKKIIKTIGYLDKRFFLFWEEADFCFRAKNAGFAVLSTPKAVIEHKGSASFVGGKPHTEYYWWRNRFLWIEKNCPRREVFSHFIKIFIPEILHNAKMYLIKRVNLLFCKKQEKKAIRVKLYQTRCIALRDYLLRRFEKGPDF